MKITQRGCDGEMYMDELKTFKKITGGDSLYAEFKGQQAFEFTLQRPALVLYEPASEIRRRRWPAGI